MLTNSLVQAKRMNVRVHRTKLCLIYRVCTHVFFFRLTLQVATDFNVRVLNRFFYVLALWAVLFLMKCALDFTPSARTYAVHNANFTLRIEKWVHLHPFGGCCCSKHTAQHAQGLAYNANTILQHMLSFYCFACECTMHSTLDVWYDSTLYVIHSLNSKIGIF